MSAADNASFRPVLTTRTALILILAGLFAVTVMVVLGTFEPDSRGQKDNGAHALSPSAVGYAGMVQLLQDLGRPVVVARGRVNAKPPSVMVLTIDRGDPKTNLQGLPTTKGFPGLILAILPKWQTRSEPYHVSWAQKVGLRPLVDRFDGVNADVWVGSGDGSLTLARFGGTYPRHLTWVGRGTQMTTGPIEQMQEFTASKGWRPIVVDADTGGVIVARAGASRFFAVSDPDLFNTQGLRERHTAAAGVAVLATLQGRPDAPVFFDVTLNGFGRTRSMAKALLEPPFLAATLSVLAAAALMGWAAFIRFGAPARQGRAFALGKQALADNQAALIRMTRREHRLGGRYVQLVRERVARLVGAPRDMDDIALDAFLDRVGGARGVADSFSNLAAAANRAKTAGEMQAVAERLYRWRLAMTGETRS